MFLFWAVIIVLTIIALVFILTPLLLTKHHLVHTDDKDLTTSPAYKTAACLIFILPIVAITLYLYWGNSKIVSQWVISQKNSAQIKEEIAKFGSRQNIIVALRKKLELLPQNASSAKGWFILGKLYFNEKNYQEAIYSFQQAMHLAENPEYMLYFVSAKFYLTQHLDTQDEEILKQLLNINPQNTNAINLLALDAYQHKNFSKAIYYWEKLLQFFPPESEDSKVLLAMIHQAELQSAKNGQPTSQSAIPKIAINIRVSNKVEKLRTKNETLYVYALARSSSKMPIAALRLSNYQFPADVTLDDSNIMIPGNSLAGVDQFYIEARLSKTGNALPAKGDLFGTSGVIKMKGNRVVAVEINQIK